MENEKMNVFKKFYKNLIDFKSYRYFHKETMGRAFLYLLLITLIFGGIISAKTAYNYNTGVSKVITYFNDKVPDFTLENGELNVDADMPIKNVSGNDIMIIDTTNDTSESILDNYDTGILITKDKMIQKKSSLQTTVTQFSSLGNLKLTKAMLKSYIPLLKIGSVFIVGFMLIGFYLSKLFSALLISLIGLIFNSAMDTKLDYGNIYKFSIYSLTVPIIIKTIIQFFNITVPFFFLIYYGIAALWLGLGIREIRKEAEGQEE